MLEVYICVSAGASEKEILKLNGVTLKNKIAIEDATSTRKAGTQSLQKHPKRPFVVSNTR